MSFNIGDIVEINESGSWFHGRKGTVINSNQYIPANEIAINIDGVIYSVPIANLKVMNTLSNGQPIVYKENKLVLTSQGWISFDSNIGNVPIGCPHKWRKYFGLNEKFQFCEQPECKEKRDYDA